MKLKTYLRRSVSWGLCLFMCAALLVRPALAAESIRDMTAEEYGRECSLLLNYPGVKITVELYKVADVSRSVSYDAAKGQFASVLEDLGEDLNTTRTAGDWRTLAKTLSSHLPDTPFRQKETQISGEKSTASFTGLKPGLYLVTNQTCRDKDVVYKPAPYLVCLPNWMSYEDGTGAEKWGWVSDVEVRSKVTPEDPGELVSLQVVKRWRNENGGTLRNPPNSIQVELLKDGKYDRTITLTKADNWKAIVQGLDSSYSWTVREVRNSGYRVTYHYYDEFNVEIVNTLRPSDPSDPDDPDDPPDKPDKPDKPGKPDNPDPPDNPNPPDEPDNPTPTPPPIEIEDPDVPLGPPPKIPGDPYEEIELDDPEVPLSDLPQTGQLWWPVPLLAISGIFLFLIGWVRYRGAQYEE